ncbi:exodeoxyribonuclease V [Parafrankia colletiae]|uniref:Exodeoxyribonuclease V n=1 Tax=Parafrankia colletiae TaxID=573497 RepID=A0A1S1QXN1_9ACTN|nr:AAA family ATPase [Parafrankia colletiae]MCK9898658.1 AAA family ATPase [Frankia sp. Cpl3]OHV39448.1 exodeoxyribonuclease V [Parafrankia colletiae]
MPEDAVDIPHAPASVPGDRGAAPDGAAVFAAFCDAGLWPGLGRTTAGRLGEAGIERREQVDLARLSAVPGVSGPRARRLLDSFRAAEPAYAAVELLVAARMPARLARGLTDALGPQAAEALRADPWSLLDGGTAELGDADRFARHFGLDRGDPRRGPAVVTHLLARAASRAGDTAAPVEDVTRATAREGVAGPAEALTAALDTGRAVQVDDRVALERYAMAEQAIADGVERLLATAEPLRPGADGPSRRARRDGGDGRDGGGGAGPVAAPPPPPPPATMSMFDDDTDDTDVGDAEPEDGARSGDDAPSGLDRPGRSAGGGDAADGDAADPGAEADRAIAGLDEVQLLAARTALEVGVSVLTGGPGTGKSRTVAAVVRLAEAAGVEVALAAPTGRAAKRLEELCGAPASTLHRLLGAQGRGGGFNRDEHNPLDADLVVVDETSMLDAELGAALLDACADGTHLLLVGDPAQLPSIGPGQLLADLLESETVPVTELTRLYRQADGGAIATMAAAVRHGELPPPPPGPGREVVVVPARSSGEAAHRVVQLVSDSIPRALGIPSAEVQVVTPVHGGPAGTTALNTALKRTLNPGPGEVSGFDVGDRVVATANHLDLGFANGEIGVVVALGERGGLRVAFPGGELDIPSHGVVDLRHGWAVTVHRAQGSEWAAVVGVFPPEAGRMLNRPLIYTAITRARSHLSVVSVNGPALRAAVRDAGGRRRMTLLPALLAGGSADPFGLADDIDDEDEIGAAGSHGGELADGLTAAAAPAPAST